MGLMVPRYICVKKEGGERERERRDGTNMLR